MKLLSESEVSKLPAVHCKEPVHTFKTHITKPAGQRSTLAGLPLQGSYHSIAAGRMAVEDGRHADTLKQRLALNKRLLQRPQHLSHSRMLHLCKNLMQESDIAVSLTAQAGADRV